MMKKDDETDPDATITSDKNPEEEDEGETDLTIVEDDVPDLVPPSTENGTQQHHEEEEEERCVSPGSDKSAPDAAYEFETGDYVMSSDEEFHDDYFDELIENAGSTDDNSAMSDVDESEESSLFDSGFGSMKNYPATAKKSNKGGDKARRSPRKHQPNSRFSSARKRSASTDGRTTRSGSSSAQSNRKKSLTASSSSTKPGPKELRKRKPSDIDSGKDSPKATRTAARSKKLAHMRRKRGVGRSVPAYHPSSSAQYHTRSSRHKLLGQEEFSKKLVHQRKTAKQRCVKKKRAWKARYNKSLDKVMNMNEDEEVKFAAGSLLHLAGLLKSPFHLPE